MFYYKEAGDIKWKEANGADIVNMEANAVITNIITTQTDISAVLATINNSITSLQNLYNSIISNDIPSIQNNITQITTDINNLSLNLTALTNRVQPVELGGTNMTVYSPGDIIYAENSQKLSVVNIGSNGQFLISMDGIPQWQTVDTFPANPMNGQSLMYINGAIVWNFLLPQITSNSNAILQSAPDGSLSWVDIGLSVGSLLIANDQGSISSLMNGIEGQFLGIDTNGALTWKTTPVFPTDIMYRGSILYIAEDGTTVSQLEIGSNGRVLRAVAGLPSWELSLILPSFADVGDILYADTVSTLGKLPIGSVNRVLMSNGTNPVWGTIIPSTMTANRLMYSKTSTEIDTFGIGSARQILRVNSLANGIEWATLNVDGYTFPISTNIGDIVYATGNKTLSNIPIGTLNQVLTSDGTNPIWGMKIPTTLAAGRLVYTDSTSSINSFTAGTANQILRTDSSGNLSWWTSNVDGITFPASSSITPGDILYATQTGFFSRLSVGSPGQVLGVSSGVPSWSANINLPLVNSLTANTVIYADSTNNIRSLSAGTSGQVLRYNGTNLEWWTSNVSGLTFPTAGSIVTGDTIYATAMSTLSRLPIGLAGQVLGSTGTVPSWTATIPLPLSNTLSANGIMYADTVNSIRSLAIGSSGQVLTVSNGALTWADNNMSGFLTTTNTYNTGNHQTILFENTSGTTEAAIRNMTVEIKSNGNARLILTADSSLLTANSDTGSPVIFFRQNPLTNPSGTVWVTASIGMMDSANRPVTVDRVSGESCTYIKAPISLALAIGTVSFLQADNQNIHFTRAFRMHAGLFFTMTNEYIYGVQAATGVIAHMLVVGGNVNALRVDVNGTTLMNNLITNGRKVIVPNNSFVGTATLSGGSVTVFNTNVDANSKIFLTYASAPVTAASLYVGTIINNTSFVIASTYGLDTSLVNWHIVPTA